MITVQLLAALGGLAWLPPAVDGGVANAQKTSAQPGAGAQNAIQPTTQPTAQSATEPAPKLDEADLAALIGELNPPSLEEILAWFEPIPTVQQVADALHKPEETVVDETEVAALEAESAKLAGAGRHAEAVSVAQQLVGLLTRVRGPAYWQTVDARAKLERERCANSLSEDGQAAVARLGQLTDETAALYRQTRYCDALPLLREEVDLAGRYLGKDSMDYATAVHDLAFFLRRTGELTIAEKLYRGSLQLHRRALGSRHPLTARVLQNYATLLAVAGYDDQAVALLCEAVDIQQETLGPRAAGVLSSCANLAGTLAEAGDCASAALLLRHIIELDRTAGRDGTAEFAGRLANLGYVLRLQGDKIAAEDLYRKSRVLLQALLGPRHPKVAKLLNNTARLLEERGLPEPAEQHYREARAILAERLGKDHLETLAVTHNLACLLLSQGQAPEAERMLREALAAARLHLPADDALITDMLHALAACQEEQDEIEPAIETFRAALALKRGRTGAANPAMPETLLRLGLLLGRSARSEDQVEGERMLAEAVSIARRLRLPLLYRACTRYAGFLRVVRKQAAAARPLYEEAIEQVEQLRVRVGGDELDRAAYYHVLRRDDPYGGLARVLLSRVATAPRGDGLVNEDAAAAYQCLERGRGRALLDLLDRGGRDLYSLALERAENRRDDALRRKIVTLRERDTEARMRRLAAEKRVAATLPETGGSGSEQDESASELVRQRDEAAELERQIQRDAFDVLRGEVPSAGLQPLAAGQIVGYLKPRELLLAYDVGDSDTEVLLVDPSGAVRAAALKWPDGGEVTRRALQASVCAVLGPLSGEERYVGKPDERGESHPPRHLAATLIPSDWRAEIAAAARLLVVADGPLHQLPFEMLVLDEKTGQRWIDVGPPIVYGPSGTVIMTKRKWAQEHRQKRAGQPTTALVALGDPIFTRPSAVASDRPATPEPDHGVLLALVTPEGTASASGLRAGDVLLTYDGQNLAEPADLGPAIQAAQQRRQAPPSPGGAASSGEPARDGEPPSTQPGPTSAPAQRIPVTIWRDGETVELTVASGKLGVQPSQATMPTALQDFRELQLSDDQRFVNYANAATRDGFGELRPLPGTRAELNALRSVMEKAHTKADSIKILAGEEATLTSLVAAADKPRFLHLATHGLAESGPKVYESALALTVPESPTPDDFGFLRLQDLLCKWGGKLEGTELVVLSGCRTGRGRLEAADGFVGLTWGFLFAGADSVIASLWKVDDAATALLMNRLYENLLGTYAEPRGRFAAGMPMPKADALHEARRWLHTRSPEQNRRALEELGLDTSKLGEQYRAERDRLPTEDPQKLADPFDYSGPRFWAAFVLIGDPD